MKLLIFAHTPPPLHGQSYMVDVLLQGLGGDRRRGRDVTQPATAEDVHCYHVNARLSDSLQAVGSVGPRKLWRLVRYCAEAVWCRFQYGVRTFYYVPAPPKRGAIYRDWIVLALCRPFFPRVIFHWHASGLGAWLEHDASGWERWITQKLAGHVELSVVLAEALAADAARLQPRRLAVLPNGISDPCPTFSETLLPQRRSRLAERRRVLDSAASNVGETLVYRVLFLANCTRDKGLFDAIEAVIAANRELQQTAPQLRMDLLVAGAFVDAAERREFEEAAAAHTSTIHYQGFVAGETKTQLLRDADCLCFPSYYPAEGQPVSIVEAMAFGLSVTATRWRAIPEMLPNAVETVPIQDPVALSRALLASMSADTALQSRSRFEQLFSRDAFLRGMRAAIESLEDEAGQR